MKLKDAKYFGIKLSPHRIKNDKGQLIVTGCEFARTGKQKYHSSELDVEGDKFIYLDRPVEEVSDPKTVASFEGAPVTLDHPEDDVKVGVNYDELAKGFATNVKYIADSDKEGHLQADFIFTDADLIKKIENNEINELSAGYNCDVDETDWVQRHIRGNHIAVVAQARAGHQARLLDKAYKSTSKSQKTLKIGDSVVKIVDSYSYELEELDGTKTRYTDYYTEGRTGKKKFVTTLKDEDTNRKISKVKDSDKIYKIDGVEYILSKDSYGNYKLDEKKTKNRVADWDSYSDAIKDINKWVKQNKITDSKKVKDSDEELIANRRRIDKDIRKTFEAHPEFEVEGFYNGVDDTEGTIYVVDYIRRKDKDPNRPRRNDYDDDEDYLEDLRDYVDEKWYEIVRNITGVESVDIDVCEWDCSEECNIDMMIYCDGVSRD